MFTRRRTGTSIRVDVEAPMFDGMSYGETLVLDVSAIIDRDRLSLFVVNRDTGPLEVQIRPENVALLSVESAECVSGSDLGSTNSLEDPDAVSMRPFDDIEIQGRRAVVKFPSYTFTAITFVIS